MAWAIGIAIAAGIFLLAALFAACRAAGRYDDESDAMMMAREVPPPDVFEVIRLRDLDGRDD
jgi:hypothetical protein